MMLIQSGIPNCNGATILVQCGMNVDIKLRTGELSCTCNSIVSSSLKHLQHKINQPYKYFEKSDWNMDHTKVLEFGKCLIKL